MDLVPQAREHLCMTGAAYSDNYAKYAHWSQYQGEIQEGTVPPQSHHTNDVLMRARTCPSGK